MASLRLSSVICDIAFNFVVWRVAVMGAMAGLIDKEKKELARVRE